MEVWFTPTIEKYVDTSLENNPSLDKSLIPNIEVWSIFKRKKEIDKKGDGNPLIYALKGEKGWEFRSPEDRIAIEKQFNLIADKFVQRYPVGVTIILPSGSELNRHIAEVVISKSKDAQLIEGVIRKLTTEEVENIVMKKDSAFRSFYGDEFNEKIEELCDYLEDMDRERNGMFSRHLVQDSEMRNILSFTMKVSTSNYARKSKYINDRDILIIDDTISRGQSIRDACRIITESYSPKSITVLTLLSKLYVEN